MKAKPLPYYPFYVSDFDEDPNVLPMNLAEVGLYILALNESWKRGGIPASLPTLALRIRRPLSQVKRAWPRVSICWEENGVSGLLVNPRQEKERIKAKDRSEQARSNIQKRYSTDVATGVDSSEDTGALLRASVSVFSSEYKSKKKKERTEVYLGQFANWDLFWASYWRKDAKQAAFKSYCDHVKTEEQHREVMAGIYAQSEMYLERPPDKRPHGSTWLNQHRWEDDLSSTPQPHQKTLGERIAEL